MKKLAIALAGALLMTAATPVFACPHDEDTKEQAPKTAEKAKDADKAKTAEKDKAKAKVTPVKAKTPDKKPDKVVLN